MANVARVAQHNMLLHILLQNMQTCQQQIMCTHEVLDLQHNCPEFIFILGNRGPLLQVKQVGLVLQGMVQVTELGFQGMAKILPCAYTQPYLILVSYQSPPGQRLSREQGDSHLDNFHRLHYTRHFTKLLDIERPICQPLGSAIKFLRLLQIYI